MTPREHLLEPVLSLARRDFTALRETLTVGEALAEIRRQGLGERIVYFYVVDAEDQLVGVLPVRRLLTAPLETPLRERMIRRVVALPQTATVLDACELFALHKFLAFPIVDDARRLVGVVDVNLFTDEVFDLAERERVNEVFEAIGFRVTQVRDASPWLAFRYRFPWLLVTLVGGSLCAFLAGAFADTLAQTLVLAFFLTLVLGVGESVAVQSLTMTIRLLHARQPTLAWFARALGREVLTAVLLGLACGGFVAVVVWLWQDQAGTGGVIGACIVAAMTLACVFGISIPTVLHALRLDVKIAAGPLTLALADLSTLLIYLGGAAWLL